ncbi:peptidylprolyl isomerase [Enterococcus sp. JM9B]|uniref:peptidylprolyl isomerase n=1 Tax=Enterococcus sp. JM9B TaxID=1857216 RepID=UPI001374B014|nr:peptidylprolyl isomerase [Enterococcus sp. JM9B]KAF1301168.1 peptidylprolyl isomerase [Enterococcus sp. JM9B]
MKTKKWLIFGSIVATFFLGACGNQQTTSSSSEQTTESSVDLSKVELPQLSTEVAENEDLIEMVTTDGSIKIKLFPEQAPKAVENFVTHAKDGYYDGLTFHRVVEDFMIQGGDPKGDGSGGESIWGEGFGPEISNQLYNIRGALSMAQSSQPNSIGSQFFIVQNHDDMSGNLAKQFTPEKIIETYKEGGAPSLDGQYTVFGQVIEGMDVVDKIAKAETTGEANSQGEDSTPKKPVKIESIKILQEAK